MVTTASKPGRERVKREKERVKTHIFPIARRLEPTEKPPRLGRVTRRVPVAQRDAVVPLEEMKLQNIPWRSRYDGRIESARGGVEIAKQNGDASAGGCKCVSRGVHGEGEDREGGYK